jgi:hypothetical protein
LSFSFMLPFFLLAFLVVIPRLGFADDCVSPESKVRHAKQHIYQLIGYILPYKTKSSRII